MEREGRSGKRQESQFAALTQKGSTVNVTRDVCWLRRKLDEAYKRVFFFQSGKNGPKCFLNLEETLSTEVTPLSVTETL